MIPPTIGRIVHFNLKGTRKAAVVTAIHSHTTVDLEVLGVPVDHEQRFVEKAPYGEEAVDDVAVSRPNSMINKPGCWAWPPRV